MKQIMHANMTRTKNLIARTPILDKLAQTGKTSVTKIKGSDVGKSKIAQDWMQPCKEEFEALKAKFSGKSTADMWTKVELTAQKLSDMLHVCRVRYLDQLESGDGDQAMLRVFSMAGYVLSEQLFVLSACAAFFGDAEQRKLKTAKQLRRMFDEALWCKGREDFDSIMAQIFESTDR